MKVRKFNFKKSKNVELKKNEKLKKVKKLKNPASVVELL